jgi:hypothetical protein
VDIVLVTTITTGDHHHPAVITITPVITITLW